MMQSVYIFELGVILYHFKWGVQDSHLNKVIFFYSYNKTP